MKVRRSECGVMPSGSGLRPPAVRFSFARSTDLATTRRRALLRSCRAPLSVGNTKSSASPNRVWALWTESSSRSAGSRSTWRTPASVFESATRSRPAGRSTSRQHKSSASLIRNPASVRVASSARRGVARRSTRAGIELASGVEQRDDLLRAVEPGPLRPALLQPSPLPPRRVAIDQLALDSDLEDLREPRDRLVDRRRRDRPLAHLLLPVAVDLGNRDLRKPMLREGTCPLIRTSPRS